LVFDDSVHPLRNQNEDQWEWQTQSQAQRLTSRRNGVTLRRGVAMFRLLLVAVSCLGMVGCDAGTLGYVKKAKYDALQKQLEKAEADLKTAQQEVSECQGHKYQIYNESVRPWQLDLVTGQKCILLTTEADLKKPETKMQVCN
jgi:hypothetical protein